LMFLACRSGCGHCEVYPRLGLGRGLRCSFLPLPYSTRFLPKYKARRAAPLCGNRWESLFHLAGFALNTKRSNNPQAPPIQQSPFRILESYKACCCDDRCESVDTSETPTTQWIYRTALRVAICENLGKLAACQLGCHEIRELIHSHQHIFRTFLKPSPQHLTE